MIDDVFLEHVTSNKAFNKNKFVKCDGQIRNRSKALYERSKIINKAT